MTTPVPDPLFDGLARWLAEAGHGTYRVGSAYAPGEVAIVFDDVIPDPARLLVLRRYLSGGEPDSLLPYSEPFVQLRIRGATGERGETFARAKALWSDLHGLGPVELPGGVIVMSIICTHPDPLPIGRDEAGRYEHTLNIRIDHVDATEHRA